MCARPPAALALLQLPCLRLAFGSPEACKLVLRRPPFNLAKKHIKPFATPSLRPALVCWPAAAGLAPSHPVPNPPNREPAARPTEPPMLPPKPVLIALSPPHRDEPCRAPTGSAGRPASGRTSARVVAPPDRPLLRPARRRQLLRTSTDVFRLCRAHSTESGFYAPGPAKPPPQPLLGDPAAAALWTTGCSALHAETALGAAWGRGVGKTQLLPAAMAPQRSRRGVRHQRRRWSMSQGICKAERGEMRSRERDWESEFEEGMRGRG